MRYDFLEINDSLDEAQGWAIGALHKLGEVFQGTPPSEHPAWARRMVRKIDRARRLMDQAQRELDFQRIVDDELGPISIIWPILRMLRAIEAHRAGREHGLLLVA